MIWHGYGTCHFRLEDAHFLIDARRPGEHRVHASAAATFRMLLAIRADFCRRRLLPHDYTHNTVPARECIAGNEISAIFINADAPRFIFRWYDDCKSTQRRF